ncbi:MAG: tRNA pseudouridine(55) synthase TruB [Pirellulales bacterium]
MPPIGIVSVNKPPGMTSRRVVDLVLRQVRPAKVGHAGTLDPLASGVLVVCIGKATRLVEYVQRMPKHYQATFLLGRRSPSDDVETEVTQLDDPPRPSPEQLAQAVATSTGTIEQRPPPYSAVKIGGQRAYKLARRGLEVAIRPRRVIIHALRVTAYTYPRLELDIQCSGGTYVRSLGRDLAESLGSAAVMEALVRTAVGPFRLDAACPIDQLVPDRMGAWLRPPADAVCDLPTVQVSEGEVRDLSQGKEIAGRDVALVEAEELAAVDQRGQLVAIVRSVPERGMLRPSKFLLPVVP